MSRKLTFLVLVLLYKETKCECRQSFMTFCDDLDDIEELDDFAVENWTDLVVGDENADVSKLRTVDFDTLALDRLQKVTNLIVVRQIRDIKANTFTIDPDEVKVNYIKLYGNDIKRIRSWTFGALILRKLSLTNNSIEYIHKGAFDNCEIQTIDLSYNKLEMIEVGVFTDEFLGQATKEMVFTHNKLESIQKFSLPNTLEILNLDHNNIDYLEYGVFDNLVNLQVLTMSHNKMQSLPKIQNLTEITIVDASYNSISYVSSTDLSKLSHMEVLDLSHNEISNPVLFQQFKFPERQLSLQISLGFNRLTHLVIEGESFRNHIVSFYGNPWNCKCWESLERFMVENKVRRNKCDLKYFGNGQIPYCLYYPSGNCTETLVKPSKKKDETVEGFLESIKKTQSIAGCKLALRPL